MPARSISSHATNHNSSSSLPPSAATVFELLGAGRGVYIHNLTLHLCGGDYRTAAFAQQIIYWQRRSSLEEGWVAKTYEEWDAELMIPESSVRRCVKALQSYGLQTQVRRSPFHGFAPVVHYRFNLDILGEALTQILEGRAVSSTENNDSDPEISQDRSLQNDGIDPSRTEGSDPSRTKGSYIIEYAESIGREEGAAPQSPAQERATAPPSRPSHSSPEEDLPDHLSPAQRRLASRPPSSSSLGNAQEWQLVEAYCQAVYGRTNVSEEASALWGTRSTRETAAQLVRLHASREEIQALALEKLKASGGYAFRYLASDLVEWRASRQQSSSKATEKFYAPPAPPSLTIEDKAIMKALRKGGHHD